MRGLQPFGLDKKLLEATHFGVIKIKYHMCLMDNRGVDFSEAIVDTGNTGVIIGAHSGDHINRFAGRGLRAEQLIEFISLRAKFNVGQKQMLIEIARGHDVLGVVEV